MAQEGEATRVPIPCLRDKAREPPPREASEATRAEGEGEGEEDGVGGGKLRHEARDHSSSASVERASLLPLSRPFTWYALVHEAGDQYGSRLLPLGDCSTVKEFFQYLHHIPAPGQVFDGRHGWRIGGKHWGYGLCFFESCTRPEWEHPNNARGVDLVCRGCFSPPALSEAWRTLLLMLVSGEMEGATGARLAYKPDRRGSPTHKIEVWCRSPSDAPPAASALRSALGADFATVPRRGGGGGGGRR